MGMRVLAAGLAVGLAGFLLGAGCSQQEPAEQAGAAMERKAAEVTDSARTDAADRAVQAVEKSAHELSAGVRQIGEGAGEMMEEAAKETEITIERSGQDSRDAYEAARARAKRAFEGARDR